MGDINIQEIRKKYPSYGDLSDIQLADKLHNKYYSDIPKDEFYSKIGLHEHANVEKLKSSLINNRTPLDTLRDVGAGVVSGLGRGGQAIGSALTFGYAPKVNWNEIEDKLASPRKSIAGNIERGIGNYLPYGVAAGPSLAGQLAGGGAYGAATTEPNESNLGGILPSGEAGGAVKGALVNALTHGAFNAFNALRPSQLLRGTLSPEELKNNLEVTKDTNTNLGDVINSPFLKRQYENVLPRIPFSGADEVMQKTANQVKQKGEDLLGKIGQGYESLDPRAALQSALKKASVEARNEKNKSFENINKIADDANLNIGRNNFRKTAQNTLQEIEASQELKREFPKDLYGDLQSYATNDKGNSLKLTNIFKGKIGDKAQDAYINGNMYEYGILRNLKDSIGKDIDESIENSNNPGLKSLYEKTQKDYAEKFAPFEDPDITKFTRQGGDSDLLLSRFLKNGHNDRGNLLSKLLDKLPEHHKELPAYNYLSKAIEDGELKPLKFRALYNKLGQNQKQILIPDKNLREAINKYVDLVGKNTESFNNMYNPKTGQRALDSVIQSGLGLTGYRLGGLPGAVAGLTVPGLAAHGIVKGLTSPGVREALIKAMIDNKQWDKNLIPALQTSAQGIFNR